MIAYRAFSSFRSFIYRTLRSPMPLSATCCVLGIELGANAEFDISLFSFFAPFGASLEEVICLNHPIFGFQILF